MLAGLDAAVAAVVLAVLVVVPVVAAAIADPVGVDAKEVGVAARRGGLKETDLRDDGDKKREEEAQEPAHIETASPAVAARHSYSPGPSLALVKTPVVPADLLDHLRPSQITTVNCIPLGSGEL